MIIKNIKIVNKNSEVVEAEIKIEENRIVKVGKSVGNSDMVLDGKGKLLLPGGVDNHVHIYKTYLKVPTSDDVKKSTSAALLGGTTTVIDFAFVDREPNLDQRIEQFKDSATNYSFHIFANTVSSELSKIFERGFKSVKFMMIEYAGLKSSLSDLIKLNEFVKERGGYIMVHAEDEELIKVLSEGKVGEPALHLLTRPEETEISAVARVNAILDRGLIAHTSAGKSLDIIDHKRVKAEAVLHHLILDKSVYDRKDSYMYVTSPPVRDPEELWKRIDKVYVIATDHNWFNKSVKEAHNQFPDLVPGLPGIELRVPMIITEFIKRGLPLHRAIELLSENPARLNGLDTGAIKEGYRADLVLYDLSKKWKISINTTHMADWTPYEGYEVIGKVDTTIVNGEIVVEGSEIVSQKRGELLYNNL
ncbi:amidohydrolase family protein [Stygiolobus caldivivus]|uniref:D-hydantoinase n=1 Tax=Stygiolobus caldivivus TaxID=2824673 RepID=A0A8D5U915_9CREN|nr:amidohydrolase family protein [Stygiolobus caldivivus]BCU71598.1 D-hydantoinase [Stygiolobus caldivivus]